MPNQMIALQARNPQLPDPAAQTAKYVNMMNMARQQETAQLQGERARQEMAYATAKEGREAELQAPRLAEAGAKANTAQLTFVMDFYKKSADNLINSSTPEQAVARGERLKSMFPIPALQAQIDETITDLISDPSQFETKRKQMLINTLDAKDQLAVEHSDIFDADGNLLFKESSKVGAFPTRLTPGVVTNLPSTATASPPAAAPRTPVGTGADMRATQGSNTTPQDLIRQGMNPDNVPSGMPTSRPISFNQSDMGGAGAGQMTPEVMSNIVKSAFDTGVMAQVDFDQLLTTQPPENRQAFTDAFRRANVTLQADAPSLADSAMGQQQSFAANPVQTPQAEFAVYRGEPREQTLAQYKVGQQVKGKNPAISPAPAETPQQAGERARNIRQTPAEAAAITAAIENTKVGIQTKAKLAEEIRTRTRGRKLFSAALDDMRKDYNTLNKLQAIPSTGRPALDNFGDYLSSSYLGRKAQSAVGTKASVALNNIANSRLTLLNALKEVTNMSATQLSSNIELMTFLDSLADPTQGYESAMETIRRLENLYGAPAAAQGNRKTPVVASGWGKVEVEPN